MDRIISAIWYDVADSDRTTFVETLHEDHLPAIRAMDGCLWAAHYRNIANEKMRNLPVAKAGDTGGTGSQFAILSGWGSLDALLCSSFGNSEYEPGAGAFSRMRSPQSAIFNELLRVNGPEYDSRPVGAAPAPCIQMGMVRMKSVSGERQLANWYLHARLPLIATMKGAIGGRVFSGVLGWAKFAVLYEFESIAARSQAFEPQEVDLGRAIATDDTGHLSERERRYPVPVHELIHPPGSPIVGERLWPPV